MVASKSTSMKISNRQLSLRGLRTFCVAARHRSFRLAAEELFVTASAVSHQIKSLEEELGTVLFERSGRQLELTATGRRLFEAVDPLLRQLDEATAPFRARANRHTLRISVQPFFASELFVPRLASFTSEHPDIDIHVDTSDESPEKHPATADVSIRLFRAAPAGLASDLLFPLRLVPACSPELLSTVKERKSKKVRPFPIVVHAERTSDWKNWGRSSGIEVPEPASIVQLNSMIAVVRAAERGLGVAMVPMPLCEAWFESGRLVRLYDAEVVSDDSYYIVYASDDRNAKAVRSLRDWAIETFAEKA